MVPVKKPPPGSLSVNTVGTPPTSGTATAGSTPNIFAAATATPKSMINTTGERKRIGTVKYASSSSRPCECEAHFLKVSRPLDVVSTVLHFVCTVCSYEKAADRQLQRDRDIRVEGFERFQGCSKKLTEFISPFAEDSVDFLCCIMNTLE